MGRCRLKLKNYNTDPQRTNYKYNIEILKDDEARNRFQLTISNTYQVLASLEGNEQHLGKGKNQTVVNQVWQGMEMHGGRCVRKRWEGNPNSKRTMHVQTL